MANTTKNYWYVLVCTEQGAKFVTSTEYHTAEWDATKPPMEMSKSFAQDVANGLCLNFHCAFAVCMNWEIDRQPYYYERGHFEWVNNEAPDQTKS